MQKTMEATTKDLRLHTRELLSATDRGEEVIITYRGKRRAKLVPLHKRSEIADSNMGRNPAFGIWCDRKEDVDALVRSLRERRQLP